MPPTSSPDPAIPPVTPPAAAAMPTPTTPAVANDPSAAPIAPTSPAPTKPAASSIFEHELEPMPSGDYQGYRRLSVRQQIMPWDGLWPAILFIRKILVLVFIGMLLYRFWPQIQSLVLSLAQAFIDKFLPQPPP